MSVRVFGEAIGPPLSTEVNTKWETPFLSAASTIALPLIASFFPGIPIRTPSNGFLPISYKRFISIEIDLLIAITPQIGTPAASNISSGLAKSPFIGNTFEDFASF